MSKQSIFFIGAVTLALIAGVVVWGVRSDTTSSAMDDAPIIYYYGEECPHCKEVSKFLEENHVAEKVDFVKKEVWHNSKNNREMLRRADTCDLDKDKLGVPFLWAEGQCISGQDQVMSFFKQKAGIE